MGLDLYTGRNNINSTEVPFVDAAPPVMIIVWLPIPVSLCYWVSSPVQRIYLRHQECRNMFRPGKNILEHSEM